MFKKFWKAVKQFFVKLGHRLSGDRRCQICDGWYDPFVEYEVLGCPDFGYCPKCLTSEVVQRGRESDVTGE